MQKTVWKNTIWLLGAVIFAFAFFSLLFRFDNKYTARAPITQDGAALADGELLAQGRIVWLADGWTLYPDALLSPQQITGQSPVHTYVGEHLNLSRFHADRSPYGQSTWRLSIRYDGLPASYTLLLPEVFSACKVFLNGKEVAANGALEPYQPHVQDIVFSFVLSQDTDLVIQTANFTHYYSGVTYPPALGGAPAIQKLVGARMLFYGFLCFVALSVALFSAAVWIGSPGHDRLALWFAILALSFSLRVCYPFVRLFGVPLIRSLYALEDAAALVGIWCALRIVLSLCGLTYRRWASVLMGIGGAMILVVVVFPLWVLPSFPAFTAVYGRLISAYKLLTALILCALAFLAGAKGNAGAGFLVAAVAFYGVGLAANILGIGMFEPAYTGWQDEYGAFVLVLGFAVLMVRRSHLLVQENMRLTDHLQEAVEQQTGEITKLLEERGRLLSELMHDIKSPAATMLTYTQLIRENGIRLDEKTHKRLMVIEEKCRDIGDKIQSMQVLTTQEAAAPKRELLELGTFLKNFHRLNQPDVEVGGPDFILRVPQVPCRIRGDDVLLSRMLQNLVYNAVSFTPPDGQIVLTLTRDEDTAKICLRDTGVGIPQELQGSVFERFFTTRADQGGRGLGLYIVKNIVTAHGGEILVKSTVGKGTEFTIRLPLSS